MKKQKKGNSNVLKQLTPEDWSNLKKSIIKGEVLAIKTGPWYYKLFIAIFIVLFVGVVFIILGSGVFVFIASNNVSKKIEQNSQKSLEELRQPFRESDFQK